MTRVLPSTLTFACTGSRPEPYAAGPSLELDLRIVDGTGRRVHAIALRVQVRIDPRRRAHTPDEAARLTGLFGEPARWTETLNPLQLATVPVMVTSFTGETTVPVAVPLSYDLDVACHRYLSALDAGVIPLVLLFSGTLFYAGDDGVQVGLVSWSEEAAHDLPVTVWRGAMDAHFPGSGWVRLRRDTLDRLAAYRAEHALSWDAAVTSLLGGAP
ncbi:DUF6084 family protein [Pseudonocardia nematodicida]|uniref:DUF6084 family protein n=1 Tax=Pseudonocardia nematodicida TaxID=1206997 RepID=A0ABV1K7A5_9PSEU